MEFLSNFNVKPPCLNVKPPLTSGKPTYWRLSGDGSGHEHTRNITANHQQATLAAFHI